MLDILADVRYSQGGRSLFIYFLFSRYVFEYLISRNSTGV